MRWILILCGLALAGPAFAVTPYVGIGTTAPACSLEVVGQNSGVAVCAGPPGSSNVGVGTTNPGAALDVWSTSTTSAYFRATPSGTGANQMNSFWLDNRYGAGDFKNQINFGSQGAVKWALGNDINGTGGQNFYIYDGVTATTRMLIDPSGNVGIGTTSPIAKLDVGQPADSGAAVINFQHNSNGAYPTDDFGGSIGYNFSAGASEVDFWNNYVPAVTAFQFNQLTGASTRTAIMTLQSNGNVGIGTTAPVSTMEIRPAANQDLAITSAGAGYDSSAVTLDGVNDANSANIPLAFVGSRFGFYGGNVGIGTTNPAYTLDANGAIHSTVGYETVNGNNGGVNGHVFNVTWSGSAAALWIDYTDIGNITVSSDRRVKHDVQSIPDAGGLAAIERLNPVSFYWNDKESGTEQQYGFIAQEVKEVFPNLVRNTAMKTKEAPDGLLHLEYNGLFAPIVKAIQEVKGILDTIIERLDDHVQAIARLEAENGQLKAIVCQDHPEAEICAIR